MKNLKNITAMLVLVTVMGVSNSFAGVYWNGRQISNDNNTRDTRCTVVDVPSVNGGIMISELGGIMISELAGIMISEGIMLSDRATCGDGGTNGGIMISEGIMLSD